MSQKRFIGLVANRASGITERVEVNFQSLGEMLEAISPGPKDGPGFVPADIDPGPRNQARVRSISYLVLDVEARTMMDGGTKKITGPLPPDLMTFMGERVVALSYHLLSTYSHMQPTGDGGNLGPRYRVVIDLTRPLQAEELKPVAQHVAAILGLSECVDTSCMEPARLFYLRRLPSPDAPRFAYTNGGVPLDVDIVLAQIKAEQQALGSAETRPPARKGSVIHAFNAQANIDGLLQRHGYIPSGPNVWLYPGSQTRMPGVKLFPDTGRVYSHHANDPLHGEHAHDAFSVFTVLEHGGDLISATAAAARILGMTYTPSASPFQGDCPEPGQLPDALPPVAQFSPDLLPGALRGWVGDIAHRMQCPEDFTAVAAVVVLSGLIGARAVVAPKAHDDWRVVPNLWGLVVGRPGVMKSPALAQALAPVHRLEADEREIWKAAHQVWELDCRVAELSGKANEKAALKAADKDLAKVRELLSNSYDLPAEPVLRRYVVNDSTVEKLGELLTVNQWGLLVYRDELHGLLCSMDRPGQEGARGFYLTGYDGNQGHAVDRIGRGESYVQRVCLAMLGGMQPGKVQSYVRDAVNGGAGDDGLLQRFGLTVWPDVDREFKYVDRWPDTEAKQRAWAVFERLNRLEPAGEENPQEWRFSPEAQALFTAWLVPFETEIRGDDLHPALVSHLSKYRKLVPALALIFALVDTPDSRNVIHEPELRRALAWADYLRSHAERLYVAAVQPETAGAHALLAKIRAGKLCDSDGVLWESFEPWRVAQKCWAGFGKPDDVRKAADVLAEYGWLAREITAPGSKGGRPGERYYIHPTLISGADSR